MPSAAGQETAPEKKEKLPHAIYEMRIDQKEIAKQEGIPEEMKEWLARLPESIRFKEQITLIVGENGSGKTSFARAILAARSKALEEQNPDAKISGIQINQEEPANALQQIISLDETRKDPNFHATFIEGVEVMSEIRRWAKEEAFRNLQDRAEQVSGGSYSHRLSSRQLFEQAIRFLKEQAIDFNRTRGVKNIDIVFDEPEQGLSPRRQLDLPAYLAELIEEGDTLLVPTNNLALFLSDLPRLDLSKPERGIFRPSDFNEGGTIELHGASEKPAET